MADGVVRGSTTAQIVSEIRGTRAKGYSDCIIEITRRDAQAVVLTAIAHTSGFAQQQVYDSNEVKGYTWSAHHLARGTAAWGVLSTEAKVQALRRVTDYMAAYSERWKGERVTSMHKTLYWPRFGAVVNGYDVPSDTVPLSVGNDCVDAEGLHRRPGAGPGAAEAEREVRPNRDHLCGRHAPGHEAFRLGQHARSISGRRGWPDQAVARMSKPPKVTFRKAEPLQDRYSDRDGNLYSVARLVDDTKQLSTFDVPVAALCVGDVIWAGSSIFDLAFHVRKCMDADLDCPILLDWNGDIAYDRHRLIAAIAKGRRTFKARRMT